VLVEWNDTAVEDGRGEPVAAAIVRRAGEVPRAPAVVWGEETLSYGELDERSEALARHLRRLGVDAEVRVGVYLERSFALVVALLAVWKARGAYVPLDPAYPAERLELILDDAAVEVLVTQDELTATLPAAAARRRVVVDPGGTVLEAPEGGGAVEAPPVLPSGRHLAYVIYTSGSTGRPKGIAIEQRNVGTLVRWALRRYPRERLGGVLAATSVCFDLSAFELFVPLACGGTAILAQNALELPTLARRGEVTLLNTVPSAMSGLLDTELSAEAVKVVNLAGEPLRRTLVEGTYDRWRLDGVWNLYGPSEDTTYSTGTRVPPGEEAEPTIGRPLDNRSAYLLDRRLRPVPVGVLGELLLGGDGVARGYLGRPRLTAERFLPDPFGAAGGRLYRTGDLARWRSDGEIEFVGRQDHQVKVRGYRIELGEIESALGAHPSVRCCAVVAEGEGADRRLVAHVAVEPRPGATREALADWLRKRLPEPMVPGVWALSTDLPLTPNGKVDRRVLPKGGASVADGRSFLLPRDPLEARLVELWEETLEVRPIGIRDGFFDLGGHSLLALRLVGRLRRELGREVSLQQVLDRPTVEAFAATLRREPTAGRSPVVPLRVGDARVPLFVVHPASGHVLCYQELARRLGEGRSLYALRDPAHDEGLDEEQPLEALAARYVEEIRQVRAEGPYAIGGYSFGGLVAFEMARQLAAAGEAVPLLAILDTASPAVVARTFARSDHATLLAILVREVLRRPEIEVEDLAAELRGGEREAEIDRALEQLLRLQPSRDEKRLDLRDNARRFLRDQARVFAARLAMGRRYTPRPFPGDLVCFQSAETRQAIVERGEDPLLGWGELCGGSVEVAAVPGTHSTLLSPPHVEPLAAALRQRLDGTAR
jgi:amino acid adenylation domain-containing protein